MKPLFFAFACSVLFFTHHLPAQTNDSTAPTPDSSTNSTTETTSTATAPDPVCKDDAVTEIECTYDLNENFKKFGMTDVPKKGTYHYSVYLPPEYSSDTSKNYPCLFIMSPSGNANFKNVQDKLRELKWIGIALKEAKNGPWNPILANFLAAHDHAIKKFRIQEEMKFTTGFSGGARASSLFIGMRPGFRGVILQGAGFWYDDHTQTAPELRYKTLPKNGFVYMIIGEKDSNFKEVDETKRGIHPSSSLEVKTYDAAHQWAPKELMSEALDWMVKKVAENP